MANTDEEITSYLKQLSQVNLIIIRLLPGRLIAHNKIKFGANVINGINLKANQCPFFPEAGLNIQDNIITYTEAMCVGVVKSIIIAYWE